MKSKITSFIMTIISILIVSILVLLGIIIYDEFANTDVAKDVQDFVTNVTVTGEKNQSVKVPDKIIETTVDALESSDEKINYDTQKIDKYYYNQLDEYSKKIYNAMNSNKENMKSGNYEINLGTQFSDLLSKSNGEELLGEYYQSAIEAFMYDNPQVFYINVVHDYLVESIEYDQTVSQTNIYDIYGALVKKESVCEGYAKSFKYLMDSVEIPCVIVAGEGTNSEGNTENHAWNYVELDGKWYAIDCTWDDPIIIGGGKLSNSAKYKYFLKGENEFNQSHFPSGQFTENGKVFEYPPLSINNYR